MYPEIGIDVIKYLEGRSKKSIVTQASRLGISKNEEFSDKEIDIIKNRYLESSKKEMLMLLPKRKWYTIVKKAKEMGLYKSSVWTKEEIDIIRKYAKHDIQECYKRINRKPQYIRIKAKKMGIYQTANEPWTEEEINIIEENYIYGYEKLMELLPNRTYQAISTRLKMLKLKIPKNKAIKNPQKNKSGYKYVHLIGNRWKVMLIVNGEKLTFGYYDDVDEAGKVAMEKAREYGKI